MKLLVLFLGLLCSGLWNEGSVMAQTQPGGQHTTDSLTCKISGRVISEEDGKPLPGAHIFWGSRRTLVTVTDSLGRFEVAGLAAGEQLMKVSFIGCRPWEQKVVLKEHLRLEDISLKPVILDEVVVSARPPLSIQKGDTIQFNAGAMRLAEDADLEALLKKLPGFQIVDGKIMAQGQEVKKINIDGIEYALNDPAAALKNLPAKLIARIKMFDDRSEEAKFSGYDDGSKARTLNIETKNPNQMKMFGHTDLGYGLEKLKDKAYNAALYMNLFDRKQRISLMGDASLLALNDLPGARYASEGNKNKTNSLFANYSSQVNKKLQVSGNYHWNKNTSNAASLSRQEYLPTENYESRIYDNESHSNTMNRNQGASFSIDYRITEKNRIRFTPDMNFSKGRQKSLSWNSSIENGDTLNCTEMKQVGQNDNKRLGGNFSWMHAFRKTGRTLTLQAGGNYDETSSGEFRSIREKISVQENSGDSLRYQQNSTEQLRYSLRADVSYSEPLTKSARLSFNYRMQTQKDESDRTGLAFRDPRFEELIGIDTALTNKTVNRQWSQHLGINYNYNKEKITLNGGGSLQWMQMENRNQFIGKADSLVESNYLDLSPRAELTYRMNEKSNLNMTYSGRTSSPSATQLQDILDVSNPLQVSKGNPGLKKSYSHDLSMRYTTSDPMSSKFFWVSMSMQQTINQMASNVKFLTRDTLIDGYMVPKGGSLTTPVNLNGMWSLNMHANYALPVKKLHLDLSGGYQYSHQPSVYDDRKNMTQMHRGNVDFGFNTDISENFDFFFRNSLAYSYSRNSSTGKAHNLNESVMANLRWVFWKGFLIGGDYYYSYYWNKTGTVTSQSNNQLNLEIGKKFGKRQQAQLAFRMNDVFRDRNQVQYSVTDLYTQINSSTNPQDYYMLSFSYRFNRLGKE